MEKLPWKKQWGAYINQFSYYLKTHIWINKITSYSKKMPHKNVNVRKHGFNFAMCTICESLKDMISKVSKHDGRKVKNYEL